MHVLGDLADASCEASAAIGAYVTYLENDLAPRARGSFRLGADRFEQKLRLDEGMTLDADRLLAIAIRELHATQEEFRRVASRLDGEGSRSPPGRARKGTIPRPARSSRRRRRSSTSSRPSSSARTSSRCRSRPTCRWRRRRGSTAGRSPACGRPGRSRRNRSAGSTTSPTPIPAWPAERQEEHLRDFSYGALWAISIHEVFPATSCTISTCAG